MKRVSFVTATRSLVPLRRRRACTEASLRRRSSGTAFGVAGALLASLVRMREAAA
ncbi:MAG: hypothetical protein FJ096_02035 [Deltaproteobacteria bacterium]|nr:hypothetical protein [Deltaproteobacteria bacterium]